MKIKIIKKTGHTENFNSDKIKNAIDKTALRCGITLTDSIKDSIVRDVVSFIATIPPKNGMIAYIKVAKMHEYVEMALKLHLPILAEEYKSFRGYKKELKNQFLEVVRETESILSDGDTENANRDTDLIDAKKMLSGEQVSVRAMLNYELPKESATAHENLDIYIHDLRDRMYGSINCCLFDMGSVLKGGFTYNGVEYKEPNSITTACGMLEDVMNSARLQQYGGFTVPEIDTILAPYVKKTWVNYYNYMSGGTDFPADTFADEMTWKDLVQALESIEHSLHMVNNTFITFTFGIGESKWEQLVSKALLQVRRAGLGAKGVPAVFPKLVFLYTDKLHGEGAELEHLFRDAIATSAKCMYPDFLSLDNGYLGEMYHERGKIVSPMGCRAFLSEYYNEKGELIFTGRANCGAVTLNLPRYAIQAKGDFNRFKDLIRFNFEKAIKVHQFTYAKMCKVKAKTNPLFFQHGGCHIKLAANDSIKPALDTFTWSIGYIGLEEVTQALEGVSLHENPEIASTTLDLLNALIEEYKQITGLRLALYSTPAESLCYKFLNADRQKFGELANVTDKEYYTNSYHCDVRANLDADKKQEIESMLFHKAKGGRIVYNEFPHTKNIQAIVDCVRYAMKLGLYYGVNLQLDTCLGCGNQDEIPEKCPKCGTTHILRINRICGYLSYTSNERGENMVNKGKTDEIKKRVKHFE